LKGGERKRREGRRGEERGEKEIRREGKGDGLVFPVMRLLVCVRVRA
jgi:hypothetical protein